MLVKTAKVGNGNKWHIARNLSITYCGAKPDWTSNGEMEISEIKGLCANCKREVLRKGD